MSSTNALTAIIERLKEKTRLKNPGVDIMHKPKAPKPEKKARKSRKKCLH